MYDFSMDNKQAYLNHAADDFETGSVVCAWSNLHNFTERKDRMFSSNLNVITFLMFYFYIFIIKCTKNILSKN